MANLDQASILNLEIISGSPMSVELPQFGENISNHFRVITVWRISFSLAVLTLNIDLDLSRLALIEDALCPDDVSLRLAPPCQL